MYVLSSFVREKRVQYDIDMRLTEIEWKEKWSLNDKSNEISEG